MQCPFCHVQDTKVVDSRLVGEGLQVRRRRECLECHERFTTYESIELSLPRIIKEDGACEQFSDLKLKSGMLKALEKRPVRVEQVDVAVNNIMSQLQALGEREIASKTLGEWVMSELKKLDEIAYIRFASVYRRFTDVKEFKQEIEKLESYEL